METQRPWESPHSIWKTQAEYYSWLRGQLRGIWSHHPIKNAVLACNKKKIPNPNRRMTKKGVLEKRSHVVGFDCALCQLQFPIKEAQVDHIVPAGSLRCEKDLAGFVSRLLLVSEKTLRVVCKGCNATLAYADKNGCSFEEAKIKKQIIKIANDKQDRQFFIDRNIPVPKNIKLRKEQMYEILIGESELDSTSDNPEER